MSTTTAPGSDTRSEEHIQQVNPGSPEDGLRTTTVVTEVSKPAGKLRTETHKEVRGLDGAIRCRYQSLQRRDGRLPN